MRAKVVSTDAGSYIRFEDNSTTGSTNSLGAVGDDFKRLLAQVTERLRITSNGRVAIGGATYQQL